MSWFSKLDVFTWMNRRGKTPWARFTFKGIVEDGIVPIEFDYNDAFIKQLRDIGFEGINEDEIVQQFMISLVMPKAVEDDIINSSSHPTLTSEMNALVK